MKAKNKLEYFYAIVGIENLRCCTICLYQYWTRLSVFLNFFVIICLSLFFYIIFNLATHYKILLPRIIFFHIIFKRKIPCIHIFPTLFSDIRKMSPTSTNTKVLVNEVNFTGCKFQKKKYRVILMCLNAGTYCTYLFFLLAK